MYKLIDDLESLTGIKKYNLEKLAELSTYSISHYVSESILNKSSSISVDIGIGYLYFENEDNTIRYKFVPNEKFEKSIIDSYKGIDLLDRKLDENLGARITNTYKELF